MRLIGFIGYLFMGLVQLAAIYSFFYDYWHWNWLISGIAAFILSYFPFLGGCAGVYATVQVWDWAWWQGALLFFWPIIFVILGFFSDRES